VSIVPKRLDGFLTYGGAWSGLTPGSPEEAKLKIASVFYDRIILPIESRHFEGILEVFASEGVRIQDLADCWQPYDRVVPPDEVAVNRLLFGYFHEDGINPSTGGYWAGYTAPLDRTLAGHLKVSPARLQELKRRDEHYSYTRECNALVEMATGSARAWLHLQSRSPCSLIAFNEVEEYAMARLVGMGNHDEFRSIDSIYSPVELFVPSIGELPWTAINDLRKDGRIGSFRRWLTSSGSKIPASKDEALEELWDAFGELRVSTGGEVVKGILGNLPLPIPVNPAGLALSGQSIVSSRRFDRRRGWLMFIHSMRSASSKTPKAD
jgi:hypothetical protein